MREYRKPWNIPEVETLRQHFAEGKSDEQIGMLLGRTVKGIRLKRYRLDLDRTLRKKGRISAARYEERLQEEWKEWTKAGFCTVSMKTKIRNTLWRKLYAEGVALKSIAKQAGRDHTRVWHAVHEGQGNGR